ncbi:LrgB family protein [Gallaecimonas mangrovi]|uniref:LrgB family protein n=1 Tax=Gallaecimonas mangrovi TaxID=2291597 RepID=UPI000E205904|nr:LrgB family protein [Gallaecimonas mangrovi]
MTVLHSVLFQGFCWSVLTVAFYLLAKRIHRRWRRAWLTPLLVTPILLLLPVLVLHVSYHDYIRGTGWLLALLGPATVAFAVPIYEKRAFIRQYWQVLAVGAVAGSLTAMLSSWALATLLGLHGALRLSLIPRSISTPFAMAVSGDIGGIPSLTAVFVVITGVTGGVFGEIILLRMNIRSSLAKGAAMGMGAHGAGTAKAQELGREEGTIAGLVMVLVGLFNVLTAPLLAWLLH